MVGFRKVNLSLQELETSEQSLERDWGKDKRGLEPQCQDQAMCQGSPPPSSGSTWGLSRSGARLSRTFESGQALPQRTYEKSNREQWEKGRGLRQLRGNVSQSDCHCPQKVLHHTEKGIGTLG